MFCESEKVNPSINTTCMNKSKNGYNIAEMIATYLYYSNNKKKKEITKVLVQNKEIIRYGIKRKGMLMKYCE
jgi:hypothetical protein